METATTPPAPRSRRLRRWIAAWVALTLVALPLHYLVWMTQGASEPGAIAGSWGMKLAANLVHVVSAPGWLLLNAVSYTWGYHSAGLTLLAIGIGTAIDLYALSCVLRIRRRLLCAGKPKEHERRPDLSRRRLIVDGVLGAAGITAAGTIAKGAVHEPWDLAVRRYSIPIEDLPASLAGLRIVQISDTHLGPRIPAAYIAEAVQMALGLKPDLFVLTGDYIHAGVDYIQPAADLFRPLTERRLVTPVLGTLGNHDWYNSGGGMNRALVGAGVRMIDNSRVFLDSETRRLTSAAPRSGLCLAGLGDLLEDWIDPESALAEVPAEMPRIVLAHNPDTAEQKSVRRDRAPRIDLMLSGHTHGGQVRIPGLGTPFIPSRYGQKYAGGICQGPRFRVLVSRGVGMSIFPVRLGVAPELVEITLTCA